MKIIKVFSVLILLSLGSVTFSMDRLSSSAGNASRPDQSLLVQTDQFLTEEDTQEEQDLDENESFKDEFWDSNEELSAELPVGIPVANDKFYKIGGELKLGGELKRHNELKMGNELIVTSKRCKAISSCGNYIVESSEAYCETSFYGVKVWNISENRPEQVCSHDNTYFVLCVCFSPRKNYVASGLEDGIVNIWDKSQSRQVCSYNHNNAVWCVCFSPCGNYVVSGSGGYGEPGEVKVWNVRTKREVCSYSHNGGVYCVCFSPCGNYVVSGSDDKKVKVWDKSQRREVCSYSHDDEVRCVCFSPCGNYIASGSLDGKVKIWDIRINQEVCSYNHNGNVECICFSPCGNYVAVALRSKGLWINEGGVTVWDIRTNEDVYFYNHNLVQCVCFSNDHTKLISVSWDGQVIKHEISQDEKEDEETRLEMITQPFMTRAGEHFGHEETELGISRKEFITREGALRYDLRPTSVFAKATTDRQDDSAFAKASTDRREEEEGEITRTIFPSRIRVPSSLFI